MIYLDTHVVMWLYEKAAKRVPAPVRTLITQNDVLISPMVELELEYMYELGRAALPAQEVINHLRQHFALRMCEEPFVRVIAVAARQTWTRDPFDRIIVGHAALHQRLLVTKDHVIRANYPNAFWSDA